MNSHLRRARISPSDASRIGVSPAIELAGRVRASREKSARIADAFAEIEAVFTEPTPLLAGDLVVLSGALEGTALIGAKVVSRITPNHPPPRPHGNMDEVPSSETERLSLRGVARGLQARARGLAAIRRFFAERAFLEVDTPAIVPSPGLDLHLDAFALEGCTPPRYLITSPEYQMKRLLAGGIPRCFQLSHCFRRGEIGRRHNPEFTMLEWYRAFDTVDAIIDETEALVRAVAEELTFGAQLSVGGHRVDLSAPFERLPVAEAFARWADTSADEAIALATTDEDRFFRLLVDRVEPALEREPRPIFLVDYPAPFASLARLKPDDPRVAERFELYLAGIELCNGFGELTDPREQRARLLHDQRERARLGKTVYPLDERFLASLDEGMPPSAGNALGVDRLIAACLGTEQIGTVQSFPADWL
jgi:lysyl-tRNA synthetase class 2